MIRKIITKLSLLALFLAFAGLNSLQAQCTAGFTYTESGGVVTFTNTSTGGTPMGSFTFWDFGDGSVGTSAGASGITHTYSTNGAYLVCITFSDSMSCTVTYCDSILVSGASGTPCAASFTYSVGALGLVSFSNTSTGIGGSTTATWSFGDGSGGTSTGSSSISHAYAGSGPYTVCLTISDSASGCSDTYCATVTLGGGGGGCSASFSAGSTGSGLFAFTNTSTGTSGSEYVTWDFGDGTTGSSIGSSTVSHSYSTSGVYLVCITVTDSAPGSSCTDTYCDSVAVTTGGGGGGGCTAGFTATESGGVASFTNTSTGIFSSTAAVWDFGDGSAPFTTLGSAGTTHTYASNGVYLVCVTITDSGCTDTYCDSVLVTGAGGGGGGTGCSVSYTWGPDSSAAYSILLWLTTTGSSSATYTWDFGDGSTGTGAYPSHVYAGAGTYVVCVTMTDVTALGGVCTATFCDTLAVTFKTNVPFSINVVSALTSVEEEIEASSWNVYPNPFSQSFNVEFSLNRTSNVSFELMDLSGKRILSEDLGQKSTGQHKLEVNPAELPKGIYILKLQAGETVKFNKVIRR